MPYTFSQLSWTLLPWTFLYTNSFIGFFWLCKQFLVAAPTLGGHRFHWTFHTPIFMSPTWCHFTQRNTEQEAHSEGGSGQEIPGSIAHPHSEGREQFDPLDSTEKSEAMCGGATQLRSPMSRKELLHHVTVPWAQLPKVRTGVSPVRRCVVGACTQGGQGQPSPPGQWFIHTHPGPDTTQNSAIVLTLAVSPSNTAANPSLSDFTISGDIGLPPSSFSL